MSEREEEKSETAEQWRFKAQNNLLLGALIREHDRLYNEREALLSSGAPRERIATISLNMSWLSDMLREVEERLRKADEENGH